MKKKLFIPIILLMLTMTSLLFCGCSDVNYLNGKDFDGNVVEQVTATIDADLFSPSELANKKSQISQLALSTLNDKLSNYNNKVNKMIANARTRGDTENELAYKELLKAIKISQPEWQENTFVVNATFKSESAYEIFYGLTEKNFKQETISEKWLYYTIYYKGNLGYYQNYGLYSVLKIELQAIFPEFSSEDTTLTYSYLTPSRRYHSNADQITHTTDGYVHTWNVTDINQEIEFRLNIANRHNWYILAIIIGLSCTLILGIVALIIVIIKHNKRKRLIYRMIN